MFSLKAGREQQFWAHDQTFRIQKCVPSGPWNCQGWERDNTYSPPKPSFAAGPYWTKVVMCVLVQAGISTMHCSKWYKTAFMDLQAGTKPSSSIRLTGKYIVVDWKIYYWGENHEDIKGNHINVTIDEYIQQHFRQKNFYSKKQSISSSLMSILSANDDVYWLQNFCICSGLVQSDTQLIISKCIQPFCSLE